MNGLSGWSSLTVVLLASLLGGCAAAPTAAPPATVAVAPVAPLPEPPPISCRPEVVPVAVGEPPVVPAADPGSIVHCVIDVGSRNVKLVVASARIGDARTLTTVRQCRSRLQLADRTQDPTTGAGRPLTPEHQRPLIALMTAYQRLCQQDQGRMVGAVATEWARRATNIAEVQQRITHDTGVALRVLSRDEEARAAYLSATRGARGKLVLDFGSRSLQLAYWAMDQSAPEALSVPLGIDEAGDRFLGRGDYQSGRQALVAAWQHALGPLVARARQAVQRRALGPELHSLGENGDLSLAVAGKLWPGEPPQAVDEAGYTGALKTLRPIHGGPPAPVELPADRLRALADVYGQQPSLLAQLRSPASRRVFGNKLLVYPALIGWLQQELGLERVVLLPQEMSEGILVGALSPAVSLD